MKSRPTRPGAGASPAPAPPAPVKARAAGPARKKKRVTRKKTAADSDLARAYAARRKAEEREKEAEKHRRVAEQEERRKRNLQLDAIIKGSTLNRKEADVPRYFEHMGRIRRVLCTSEQREQLNRGEIGVVNLRGSYLLVSPETLRNTAKSPRTWSPAWKAATNPRMMAATTPRYPTT